MFGKECHLVKPQRIFWCITFLKIKILRIGKFRGHEWNASCIFYNGIGQEWWTCDLLSLTNIHKVTYL